MISKNSIVIDKFEIATNLEVKESANFNNIKLNNVGEGVLVSDATNLNQINNLIRNETLRAEAKEFDILHEIKSVSDSIQTISIKLKSINDDNTKNNINLSDEIIRAKQVESKLSDQINELILRMDYLYSIVIKNLDKDKIT